MKHKNYVIVQAGGRGSRLRHHTWNKPKCLVSIRGKPLLYHLFDQLPNADFIVIGDYAYEQLETYLSVNPPRIHYKIIRATGKGTISGIRDALKYIPQDAPVVLIWGDLILGQVPEWPESDKPVICTTSAFTCRWTVSSQGYLHELPSSENGIPGLFYFPKSSFLSDIPDNGEFVKWISSTVTDFSLIDCAEMEELGDFTSIEASNDRDGFSRFFNRVDIGKNIVKKTVIDPIYQELQKREIEWYKEARHLGFRRIPAIYSESPLVMERIKGHHAYQMHDLSERERRTVLTDYLESLTILHDKVNLETKIGDIEDVYLTKTISRVHSVSRLIPGFERESITVNGKKCLNPFSSRYQDFLKTLIIKLYPEKFTPIHGDPTFSNTIIDDNLRVWFIDPRGYFSKDGIMGDPWYDFAKVYYSAVGGFDSFNRRKFKLHIDQETVEVLMEEPMFCNTAEVIFPEYFSSELPRIQILNGLIWLALSGYAKDDIDSVIGSFYLGLYWLEKGTSRI
jgi:GTP:adenosylcobinamide-phosphate guanylyltransferase